MTVHFRKKCYLVKAVDCLVPCETKWNRNQPKVVMQGWATNIAIGINSVLIFNDKDDE